MQTLCTDRVRRRCLLFAAVLVFGLLSLAHAGRAQADSPGGDSNTAQVCVVCHATPGLTMQLLSGETISAFVDARTYSQSVHGGILQCTACHADISGYPHPEVALSRPSVRDIPFLERTYVTCGSCHKEEYDQYVGSVHAQALNAGKSDSAICSDCHGAFDIAPADPSEVGLALGPAVYACAACHPEEFEQYKNSVHGKELLQNGNTDVPSCVDCHDAHETRKAKDSAVFRSQSLAMCTSCHADAKLMIKYGLSTQILTGYVADFHGMSAMLSTASDSQSPAQAVCYDCHGNNAIQSTVGANGLRMQENLLKTCQQCHPDASANILTAWLGHANPTSANSAFVFGAGEFYKNLIVVVVLLLVAHIVLEFTRVVLNTLQGRNHSHE
jgi:predicted CXXCH cytochrome family protein